MPRKPRIEYKGAVYNEHEEAIGVQTAAVGDSFLVREPSVSYSAHFDSKMGLLSHQNTLS